MRQWNSQSAMTVFINSKKNVEENQFVQILHPTFVQKLEHREKTTPC